MKTSHIAIALSALVAIAMLSSLMLPKGEAALRANMAWKPKTYVLDTVGAPTLWNATIWGIPVDQIDPTSIRAAGVTAGTPIAPVYTELSLDGRDDVIAGFSGTDLRDLIWEIVLYHDLLPAPGRYRLDIRVYGTLTDGTEWAGVKPITVIIPVPPPEPPPL